ncbi:hypothetical protein [Deinococcus maricopensis]|uniref:Uncharacterized protein n=1 Tax=Deinococcus maricopensis (strain DSM 21211 / LMG 22137 / NRRL B-23946 / LB-34) TaxID=709986 RepID=E8U4S2_DEIML|nr:hypothetical protein [Deinococcus maricopensis]ADV66061.1 hypothetical protein Deima_0401 [Deinococcus maricopensis DSM 21211]
MNRLEVAIRESDEQAIKDLITLAVATEHAQAGETATKDGTPVEQNAHQDKIHTALRRRTDALIEGILSGNTADIEEGARLVEAMDALEVEQGEVPS